MLYGEADLTLDVDSAGDVRRVYLDHGSPSPRIDDVLGALAAQLHLPPGGDGGTPTPLVAGYSCAATAAAMTLRVGRAR
jgi:hypothetical protein